MSKQSVEITIPVLDEEDELEQNIIRILQFMRKEFLDKKDWSIVIADNGSADRTQEISKRLVRENCELKYIRLEKRGVGLALKTSWQRSEADIVGDFDLDLATDLIHLPEALNILSNNKYEFIIVNII